MKFSELVGYFEQLEKTSSRLEMTRILAQVFEAAGEAEIDKICYLSLGRLVPTYESLEFNLAEKMVLRAVAAAIGKEVSEVNKHYKQLGDVGLVIAAELLKRKSVMSVKRVYEKLRQIAEDSGTGSQERKVRGLAELFKILDQTSGKYVARIVVGKLRLGFSDKTLIDALSWRVKGDKSLRAELEAAYFVRADVGSLAREVKKRKGVKSVKPVVGIPVMPALCQRLKSAEEMIAKMGQVAVESKFDGTRCQIHIQGKEFLKTFTRNLENSTEMFPELSSAWRQIKAKSVILDSEAVGVSLKTGKWLSFQDMMVRKRKHGVEEFSQSVPLKFYVFDILYQDGNSLLDLPLRARRKILERVLQGEGPLRLTEEMVTDKASELREYHRCQLKMGLEGVVVKKWEGNYVPGRRKFNWVKFKEVEAAAGRLADTLDCVVMGYYRGRGKRTKFGIGAFLVGVRQEDKFLTIAKVGTGLTDEQWRDLKARSTKFEARNKPKQYQVDKGLVPDVWVEPAIVVEIAADNVTRSPNHSGGLALRFPRLVRFREDKSPEQVTSLSEVQRMM
jgi:DNA ligase 1